MSLPWIPLYLPGVDGTTGKEHDGKQPLSAALQDTHGHYVPYRTSNPSAEQQLQWFADYSPVFGGPGFNPGIITGHNSANPDNALYVLDFDWYDTMPDLLRACHTTTVRTGHGFHGWFLGPAGVYPTTNTLHLPDGTICEFKGVEGLIVVPPSLHATGRLYEFEPGLRPDHIQRLPMWIVQQLETSERSRPGQDTWLRGKPLPIKSRGRLCLQQIWGHELKAPNATGRGEREVALYIFWQRASSLHANTEEQVVKALYWKNETLELPLMHAEVERIIHEGLAQDLPQNRHGSVGCHFTRDALPWVRCEDCRHGNAKVMANLGTAQRLGLNAAEWYLWCYTLQKGYKSDRAAADACHMDRETAKRAREHLQALKLWPGTEDRVVA